MASSRELLAANIVRCILAAISLAASSTIVHMIRTSPRGLKSPYSRIIFGLSIGDIIQSLNAFFMAFAVPKGTPSSVMAFGNTQTCDASGYFLVLGIFLTIFYLLFLIYFFMRRVKYRVTPQKFAKGEEFYLHIVIWIIALILPASGVARKDFNATRFGNVCIFQPYPYGCGRGDPGDEGYVECTRGSSALRSALVFAVILGCCLLCLFAMLLTITCHVYSIERNLTIPTNQTTSNENNANDPNNIVDESDKKESLTMSSVKQSLLYILSFILTFTLPAVTIVNRGKIDTGFNMGLWMNSLLIPSYGIFLILIYTRPKVKVLAEMFPEASWFLCFSTVITSGGEVPPAHELKPPENLPRMSGEDANESGASWNTDDDRSTNGVYYGPGLRSSMLAVSRCEGWCVEN